MIFRKCIGTSLFLPFPQGLVQGFSISGGSAQGDFWQCLMMTAVILARGAWKPGVQLGLHEQVSPPPQRSVWPKHHGAETLPSTNTS